MEPVTSANKAELVIKAVHPISNQDLSMKGPSLLFCANLSKSLAVLSVICFGTRWWKSYVKWGI